MSQKLSKNTKIEDLINHRVVIDHHHQRKVMDLLGFNDDREKILIEFSHGKGMSDTYWIDKSRIGNWVEIASRYRHHVI